MIPSTPSGTATIALIEKSLAKNSKFKSEKMLRCEQFRSQIRNNFISFTTNTNKENLMMKNVKEYEKYFKQTYDDRLLFLYPQNEAGVEKFICSFVRPTKTGYVELFDYLQCAEYISNYIVYEELDPPDVFPPTLVSPYNVVRWQAGDSIEIAVLYASLLIGVGYDAYVVVGTASLDITKKNEGNVPCSLLGPVDTKDEPVNEDTEKENEIWTLTNPNRAVELLMKKDAKALNPYARPAKERPDPDTSCRNDTSKNRDFKNKKTMATKATVHQFPAKFNIQAIGRNATVGNMGGISQRPFFKFDIIKEDDETPIEGQLFGELDKAPVDDENPYYISTAKIQKNNDNSDKISSLKHNNQIFHKDSEKYIYKTNFQEKFKEFLVDDESMRLVNKSIKKINLMAQSNHGSRNTKVIDEEIKQAAMDKQNTLGANQDDSDDEEHLHFWVLVRSSDQREIPENMFVDPASGRTWEVESLTLPFFSVKQIFNHRNVWINLNEDLPISDIDFDTFHDPNKNEDFEFVLDEKTSEKFAHDQESEEILNDLAINPNSPSETNRVKNSPANFKGNAPPIGRDGDDEAGSHRLNLMTGMSAGDRNHNANPLKPHNLIGQSLAERITCNEEFFQRPSSWVPKIEIEKEHFLSRYAGGRQRKFYRKSQIDYFSRGTQADGLVKRVQLYMDLKREYLYEIRSYYKDRTDRMYMKKEFPFEFRSVESFTMLEGTTAPNPNVILPHWREIEHFMGRKIIFRFYPQRFFDGLIEREEIIGEKTIERYENRDDRLVYMSVRFESASGESGNKDLYCYRDRHVEDVKVIKMVQKFDKNSFMPASTQIAKIIFDLSRNMIKVIYHMEEHQIAPIVYETSRTAFSKIMSHNDKNKMPLRSDQQKIQQLYAMEKDCFSKIKKSEDSVDKEIKNFKTALEESGSMALLRYNRQSVRKPMDTVDGGLRGHDQANKENIDDMTMIDETEDHVAKALRKRGLFGQKIDPKTAEEIKFEILSNLQERFVQRAEIIDNRFKEEKNWMKSMQKKLQKKASENGSFNEENDWDEELYHFNLKLGILETRLFNFQKIAFEKYEQMQRKLAADPRLTSFS
jgi:hypothetical protein